MEKLTVLTQTSYVDTGASVTAVSFSNKKTNSRWNLILQKKYATGTGGTDIETENSEANRIQVGSIKIENQGT